MIAFGTPWCGPCKKINEMMSEVSSEKHPGVTAVKILVDEDNSPEITLVPGLGGFEHKGYPTVYEITRNSNGILDFNSKKIVDTRGKNADQILSGE